MTRSLKLFIWGSFVSSLGSNIQWVALPLYILAKTGSPKAMGILFAASIIPQILLSPVAGSIADRWNRKKVMIITDFISGFITLIMYFYLVNFEFQLIWLVLIRCIMSANSMIFSSTTNALFPELIGDTDGTKANSLNSALNSLSQLIGPVVGAVLYSIWGIGLVVIINVLSFFGSAIFEMLIEYEKKVDKNMVQINIKAIKDDTLAGYSYLKKDKSLLVLVLVFAVTNATFGGIETVINPYLFKEKLLFSDKNFGVITVMIVVGALLGALYFQKKDKIWIKKMFWKAIIVMYLIGFIEAVFAHSYFIDILRDKFYLKNLVYIITGILQGFVATIPNLAVQMIIQERIETEWFGRVFSVLAIISMSLSPLGYLATGILLEKTSVYALLMSFGIINIFVLMGAYKNINRLLIYEKEEVGEIMEFGNI